ncbi:MAG: DUF58 domain-containing protein [Planctomycetota bacterium]
MSFELESIDTLDSRQFVMAVKRLADSLSYGTDASPFLGSGTDYVQSRIYQPGDPVRSIDWRITARTRKYHVKEFETPKRMPCYLLVDSSASMTVSSIAKSKYSMAVYLAGGLAFACLDRISPVAVVGVGESDLRYSPSLSRDKIMQWLHKLRRYQVDEKTMLHQRLREIGPTLTNRSLIIALSDLHQPEAIGPLKRMGQQHDVVALQLVDPAETNLRGAGFVRAREAETGRSITTRGSNLGIDQIALKQELKRARVDHLRIQTDQPVAYQLRHFFKSRGLLGKGAR